jgi:hypothetical protein
MPFQITGTRADATLSYEVMDAASGAPMRITVYSGVMGLMYQAPSAVMMITGHQEPMSFYVPNAEPLPPGPDPIIVPELSLTQLGIYSGHGGASRTHGVGEVQAQLTPDPQRGGYRWLSVSFVAHGLEVIGVRYRVTLYQPRG